MNARFGPPTSAARSELSPSKEASINANWKKTCNDEQHGYLKLADRMFLNIL